MQHNNDWCLLLHSKSKLVPHYHVTIQLSVGYLEDHGLLHDHDHQGAYCCGCSPNHILLFVTDIATCALDRESTVCVAFLGDSYSNWGTMLGGIPKAENWNPFYFE